MGSLVAPPSSTGPVCGATLSSMASTLASVVEMAVSMITGVPVTEVLALPAASVTWVLKVCLPSVRSAVGVKLPVSR